MSQPVDPLQCTEVLERLEEWMDGDLDPEEGNAIEGHLEGCAECRREHRLAVDIQNGLRSFPVHTLPPGLADTALAAAQDIDSPTPSHRQWWRRSGPAPILAAAAAAVFAVVLIRPWHQPEPAVYTEQEVQRAVDETKLALSYISLVTRRAEVKVRDRAVSTTVRGISRSLKLVGGLVAETTEEPRGENSEGSLS